MAKSKKEKAKQEKVAKDAVTQVPIDDAPAHELTRKEYEKKLAALHVELVQLQEWVRRENKKICVVFEGRDGAGKGGVIKALTERVSPRTFRVVALPAPTEREKSQMYVQRYVPHFPAATEVVIFDRSWYNRAGVERVMGFCTEPELEFFFHAMPAVEMAMVEFRNHFVEILARGEPGGADETVASAHHRRAQAVEIIRDGFEILRALGRIFARSRQHVRKDAYALGALARRAI